MIVNYQLKSKIAESWERYPDKLIIIYLNKWGKYISKYRD